MIPSFPLETEVPRVWTLRPLVAAAATDPAQSVVASDVDFAPIAKPMSDSRAPGGLDRTMNDAGIVRGRHRAGRLITMSNASATAGPRGRCASSVSLRRTPSPEISGRPASRRSRRSYIMLCTMSSETACASMINHSFASALTLTAGVSSLSSTGRFSRVSSALIDLAHSAGANERSNAVARQVSPGFMNRAGVRILDHRTARAAVRGRLALVATPWRFESVLSHVVSLRARPSGADRLYKLISEVAHDDRSDKPDSRLAEQRHARRSANRTLFSTSACHIVDRD